MKLKKLISAVVALAMATSMLSAFSVAEAASLGGKPTVKLEFDRYEKMTDSVAMAYIKLTVDMTEAETLEEYSQELDMETYETVTKGNGITTMGAKWTVPTGFTYTSPLSTIPNGLAINTAGDALSFSPKDNPADFWITPVTEVILAYRVTDFDAKGEMQLLNDMVTVDGKNSAESKVWSYASLAGTIDLVSCSVPSYNEWSAPAPTVDWSTATKYGDYHSDIDNSDAVAYTAELTGDGTVEYDKVTWKVTPADGSAAKGCYADVNIGGTGTYTIGLVIGDVTSNQITSVEAALGAQGNAQ